MKKNILMAVIFTACFQMANGQFTKNNIEQKAKELIPAIYLRDFNMEIPFSKKGKIENSKLFEVVLNQGATFRFVVYSSVVGQIAVCELMTEKNGLIQTIESSLNSEIKKFDFICPKTGVYKLKFRFKENIKGSILGMLLFVSPNNQKLTVLKGDPECTNKLFEKSKTIQKGIYMAHYQEIVDENQINLKKEIVFEKGLIYSILVLSSDNFIGLAGCELLNKNDQIINKTETKINHQTDYLEFDCQQTGLYKLHLYSISAKEGCASVFVSVKK